VRNLSINNSGIFPENVIYITEVSHSISGQVNGCIFKDIHEVEEVVDVGIRRK
jgi:hypothetical protein